MQYHKRTLEKIERVKKSVERGADSILLIMKDTGMSYQQVYHTLRRGEIKLPLKAERILRRINTSIEDGVGSMERLAKIADTTPYNLGVYILRHKIEIPEDIEPNRENKDICEMVEDGMSLTEMGRIFGFTGESARILLYGVGLYEEWYFNAMPSGNKPRVV